MLILDEPDMATAYSGSGAIACIAHDENWQDVPVLTLPVGFVAGEDASVKTSLKQGAVTDDHATFTVDRSIQKVETIERDGRTYTLALDPNDPQPGEFTFDYDTGEVKVYGDFPANAKFEVRATDTAIASSNPLITSLAQLPDIFQRYELQGTVEWSCSFEGQPSASFELFCTWEAADALKMELAPKRRKQMVLFGIGFEVDGLTIKKEGLLTHPDRYASVSVDLKGIWESYLDQQVILDAPTASSSSNSRKKTATGSGVTLWNRTIRGNTTAAEIAFRVGAIALVPGHRIFAPKKAGEEKTLSLEDAFSGQMRINRMFADYSHPTAIQGKPLNGTPIHIVSLGDVTSETLEIAVQAWPRAVDYENSPIEWGNEDGEPTAKGEDTQGDDEKEPPKWRLKQPKLEFVVTGSPSLESPGSVVDVKDALKMNFDSGGPVREQKTVYTENGTSDRVVTEKWGFAGVACDHIYTYHPSTGKWNMDRIFANLPWVLIEQTETIYQYDVQTGYLASVITMGERLARFKSEGGNESLDAYRAWHKETDNAKKSTKLKALEAYRFKMIPVREETTYELDLLRNHYNDIPPRPTEGEEAEEPVYNEDGTVKRQFFPRGAEVTRFTKDGQPWVRFSWKAPVPGWTDPQYCQREVTKKSAYLSMPNPESTKKRPLPDLTTGELKDIEKVTAVPDYRNGPKPIDVNQAGISAIAYEEAETFVQSERITNQLEAGLARSAKDETFTQNKGRPSEHARKVPQYEKIDGKKDTDPKDKPKETFKWRATTRGTTDPFYVGDDRILGESLSYPYAQDLNQALAGLDTDMEIANCQGTETLSIDVLWLVGMGIQPGDRVNLEEHGLWRVLGVKKSLEIVAPGVCEPKNVSLDLGKIIPNPGVALKRFPEEEQG